jgi:hypothetical protein
MPGWARFKASDPVTQPPNQQPGWWPQQQGYPAPQWQPPPQPAPGHGYPQGYPPVPPSPQQGFPAPVAQPYQGTASGFGQSSTTYGGFGAFGDATPPKRRRWKKPWLIAAAVVVVLGGGGAGAWLLGAFHGDVLDQNSVQNGVQQVLRGDFGEGDVRNVSCPKNEPVKTGTTFECSAVVAGQPKKVTVRVLNEQPQFEVGAPR